MVKGDIIVIPFPFTNLTGSKIRPACVLISSSADVTISFITTKFNWIDDACIEVAPSTENGLKKNSLVRLNKLASIDKELILGRIGKFNSRDINRINSKLKEILQLL